MRTAIFSIHMHSVFMAYFFQADVEQKITWMGGKYMKSFVKSTTHLIAKETSSQKYQVIFFR